MRDTKSRIAPGLQKSSAVMDLAVVVAIAVFLLIPLAFPLGDGGSHINSSMPESRAIHWI